MCYTEDILYSCGHWRDPQKLRDTLRPCVNPHHPPEGAFRTNVPCKWCAQGQSKLVVGELAITMNQVALENLTQNQRDKAEGLKIMKKAIEAKDKAIFDKIQREQAAKEQAAKDLAAKERARKQQAAEQSMAKQRAAEQQAARAREHSQRVQAAQMQAAGSSGRRTAGTQARTLRASKEQAVAKNEESGCCVVM